MRQRGQIECVLSIYHVTECDLYIVCGAYIAHGAYTPVRQRGILNTTPYFTTLLHTRGTRGRTRNVYLNTK